MKYVEEKELTRTLFVTRIEIMTEEEARAVPGFESYDDEDGVAIFKDIYDDIKNWLAVISNPAYLYKYAGLEIKGDGVYRNTVFKNGYVYTYPGTITIYYQMQEREFLTAISVILDVYENVHVYYDIHDVGINMFSEYTNHSENMFNESDDCTLCDHKNCGICHKIYVVRDNTGRLYEGDYIDTATTLLYSRMLNYRQDLDDIESNINRCLRQKPMSQFVTLNEFITCLNANDILYSIS